MIATAADLNADSPALAINAPTGATFKIKKTKLYILVVSLSAGNDNNRA